MSRLSSRIDDALSTACVGCSVELEIGRHLCEHCAERADRLIDGYGRMEPVQFVSDYCADDDPMLPVRQMDGGEEELAKPTWLGVVLLGALLVLAVGSAVVRGFA